MRLVILESPYMGDRVRNLRYGRAAIRDALLRGEAPIASHLLYTQEGILRDEVPEEREKGIEAGLAWGKVAHATVVYTDLGFSSGMVKGIRRADAEGRPVEFRSIGTDWELPVIPCFICGESTPCNVCEVPAPPPAPRVPPAYDAGRYPSGKER